MKMTLLQLVCVALIGADSASAAPAKPRYTVEDWRQIRARLLEYPKPDYPAVLREVRYTGSGIFRIYFDVRGQVTGIRVLKSTGHRELDIETLKGLGRWRARPGHKWELDMPVTFIMGGRSYTPIYKSSRHSPIDRW
jgi:TonB family protein